LLKLRVFYFLDSGVQHDFFAHRSLSRQYHKWWLTWRPLAWYAFITIIGIMPFVAIGLCSSYLPKI